MTVVVLIVCGVLLLAVGATASALATRRCLARLPGSFTCKVLANRRGLWGRKVGWPYRAERAVWVHDSLVVASGVLRARIRTLPVRFAEGAVEDVPSGSVRGLGPNPVRLSLELDDERRVTLAAPRCAAAAVVGPYYVALVTSPARQAPRAGIEKRPPGLN